MPIELAVWVVIWSDELLVVGSRTNAWYHQMQHTSQSMSVNLAQNLPAVFGRYILLHRISRGGMGEIFLGKLGEIQGFEKPIVIKKILPDLAQDKDFLQRFIEEAQIAIKLSHGNIVPVYEVGMVDNEYFLALQYVEGRDLRSLNNRCKERQVRIPPDLCLLIVREIANGLAYAHRKTDDSGQPLDLVHCDISPPNILVSWEGEVKIIDFGIAKSAIQRAQADENIGFGKFGYMAPEQLLRGAAVSRRADIYSTGVLLYELLTGQRLFNFEAGVDYRRVAREVTAGKHVPPSERDLKLTDQFDALVMRALRTEPGERYQSAEELRDEVQQHLYTMNPTISTDALAEFIQQIFAEEIEANRQMIASLSKTDMAQYRTELNDASTNTVSYALAGMWSVPDGGQPGPAGLPLPGVLPPSGEAAALPPSGEVVALPHSGGTGPGTRRLSDVEQAVAINELDRSGTAFTVLATQRRRTALLLVATLGVLVAVGVGVGLALRGGLVASSDPPSADSRAAPTVGASSAKEASPAASDSAVLVAVTSVDAGVVAAADAAPGPRTDADVQMTFEPEHVTKSAKAIAARKAKLLRQRRLRRARMARRRAAKQRSAGAKRPRSISTRMVQRKFRQVRQEYMRFKRSYGGQLDSYWQRILFSNTFGNMDENKHRRLNGLLDNLRRRMRQMGKGG
jgi:serine/threonine protein kinase